MKQHIVDKLEELKKVNATTAFDITKDRVLQCEQDAIVAGFDPEWVRMIFDLTNVKDWVRMALKLEHLCRVFKGRVVCVEQFLK